DRATIARLHRRFAALLDSVLADPGERLAALALARPGEQGRELAEWQDARASRFAVRQRHGRGRRTPARPAPDPSEGDQP
ncbi:MAG TPA: hypothetical protein VEG34_15775, partial [Thermoanaerobaculia bacterium]|nr:hypothetical protein [Thermoanaerobaculia bacterium]